jgi:hypothetical protein
MENNKKQTAVEWLDEQLQIMDSKSYNNIIEIEMGRDNYRDIIEQAKQMEKEQIINAYNDCEWTGDHEDGEQYYNETYESKNKN